MLENVRNPSPDVACDDASSALNLDSQKRAIYHVVRGCQFFRRSLVLHPAPIPMPEIVYQVLGAVIALFVIFLTYMSTKTWRWPHVTLMFLVFAASFAY